MTSQQSGQSAPSAPDVLVTSNVQKYAMKKKKILNAEESELFELTQAAGITIDQEIFKIIVDLLKMNVPPQAVFQTLKSMCAGQRIADATLADSSTTSSHTTSLTTAPAEHREDDSAVSGKSSKPPAPPPSSSGGTTTRPTRVNSKITVYGPQDAHSQVRSKAGAGHTDKNSSSQKVQRQPSATRGQKTKSSGSSSSSSTQINST